MVFASIPITYVNGPSDMFDLYFNEIKMSMGYD